jgi:heme exporter protein CcmD
MMPDLGTYAHWVLAAYGVSLALLAAITVVSVWQARRTRAALRALEADRASRGTARDAAPTRAETPAGEGAHG